MKGVSYARVAVKLFAGGKIANNVRTRRSNSLLPICLRPTSRAELCINCSSQVNSWPFTPQDAHRRRRCRRVEDMGGEETREYVREDPLLRSLPCQTSRSSLRIYNVADCRAFEAPTQIPTFWQTML